MCNGLVLHAHMQAAEASIAAEVAARMAAVGSNRVLWPAAAREEVERAEEKAEALAGALAAVRGELEASTRIYQEEARLKVSGQARHCACVPSGSGSVYSSRLRSWQRSRGSCLHVHGMAGLSLYT